MRHCLALCLGKMMSSNIHSNHSGAQRKLGVYSSNPIPDRRSNRLYNVHPCIPTFHGHHFDLIKSNLTDLTAIC